MAAVRRRLATKVFWVLPVFYLGFLLLGHGLRRSYSSLKLDEPVHSRLRRSLDVLQTNSTNTTNGTEPSTQADCVPPSINDFPADLFSDEQLANGAVVVHALVAAYLCYALAIICDDYFVHAVEAIGEALHMSSNVAGATIMAAGTSFPELFTSFFAVFLTESDVGIGTIVGSAVFNVLAVVACAALFSGKVCSLSWWPLTRDCIGYAITVIALILVLLDGFVEWYEAVILIVIFVLYCVLMVYDNKIEHALQRRFGSGYTVVNNVDIISEKSSLLNNGLVPDEDDNNLDGEHDNLENGGVAPSFGEGFSEKPLTLDRDGEAEFYPWKGPDGGALEWTSYVIGWPIRTTFYYTIPPCDEKSSWRKWYPVTFIISVTYIGILTYIVNWMLTVVGYTAGIPDTVMGLTFLAAGTSVPEAFSSVIVARSGFGNTALSNSIGSNIFDILICLGLPWLIRVSYAPTHSVIVHSSSLAYTGIALLSTVVFLWGVLYVNKFQLDKKVGVLCLVLYAVFLAFSSLMELNVFGDFNLPTCTKLTIKN